MIHITILVIKMLDSVDFWIGGLHIMYGNIAALVMLTINTTRIVMVYFFAYDLSKEFDLKAREMQTTQTPKSPITSTSLRKHIRVDAVLLLLQQIYTGFFISFIARVFPLVTSTLHYNNTILDGCFIAASILTTLIPILLAVTKLSNSGVYGCGIVTLLTLLTAQIVLHLIPMGFNNTFNIILLSTLVLTYSLAFITDSTYIVVTLGKLVPSSVQSSSEGLRMVLHKVGSFFAALASAYIYNYFRYVFFVSVPLGVVLLVVMIVRRDVYRNPNVKQEYERLP